MDSATLTPQRYWQPMFTRPSSNLPWDTPPSPLPSIRIRTLCRGWKKRLLGGLTTSWETQLPEIRDHSVTKQTLR